MEEMASKVVISVGVDLMRGIRAKTACQLETARFMILQLTFAVRINYDDELIDQIFRICLMYRLVLIFVVVPIGVHSILTDIAPLRPFLQQLARLVQRQNSLARGADLHTGLHERLYQSRRVRMERQEQRQVAEDCIAKYEFLPDQLYSAHVSVGELTLRVRI